MFVNSDTVREWVSLFVGVVDEVFTNVVDAELPFTLVPFDMKEGDVASSKSSTLQYAVAADVHRRLSDNGMITSLPGPFVTSYLLSRSTISTDANTVVIMGGVYQNDLLSMALVANAANELASTEKSNSDPPNVVIVPTLHSATTSLCDKEPIDQEILHQFLVDATANVFVEITNDNSSAAFITATSAIDTRIRNSVNLWQLLNEQFAIVTIIPGEPDAHNVKLHVKLSFVVNSLHEGCLFSFLSCINSFR